MLILPMATVNAVDSDHPYVDENPSILNQDLFKETFSVDEVDRVAYNYQLTPLEGGERASVAFRMKVVIDGVPYTTSAIGCINAYALPESDVLWEGPIDGEITINNIHFNIIIGFMQKASTGEAQISVTLQNDDFDFMVISFGKNIMTGDVLDCINQRFGSSSSSEIVSGTNGVQGGQLNSSGEGSVSINKSETDFSYIMRPGEGGGKAVFDIITDTDTWKFQSKKTADMPNAAYTALQTRVYFEESKNVLMITVRPYSQSIIDYYKSIGYTSVTLNLSSLKVDLTMNNTTGDKYAYIAAIDFPKVTGNEYNVVLLNLLRATVIELGVSSTLVDTVLENMKVNISTERYATQSYIEIEKGILSTKELDDLGQISTGIPMKFQLSKGSDAYVGDTPYTVKATAKYSIIAVSTDSSLSAIFPYISYNTTHEGTVTLQ